MDVFEAVKKRRSVRTYLPDPIPTSVLKQILEAGRLAPSACNLQPWHFIVVTDPQKRRVLSAGRFAKFLTKCPVVIVGCGDRAASPKWCIVDTTIALENMVLVATEKGIGTCWIGSFNEESVKEFLKIPKEFTVVAMLSVGYPLDSLYISGKAALSVKVRKKLRRKLRKRTSEISSVEEFGIPFS
jgi:nitroreductase